VALNPCVKQILCALGEATLGALNTLLQAQIAIIDAEIASVAAQLAVVDILTIPLEIARDVGQNALNSAQQVASLVPLNFIAGCADLGDLNVNLSRLLANASADFNDIINDLNRKLSLREELNALILELQAIREQFGDIQLTIAECNA